MAVLIYELPYRIHSKNIHPDSDRDEYFKGSFHGCTFRNLLLDAGPVPLHKIFLIFFGLD
jgi:hypothetical protein